MKKSGEIRIQLAHCAEEELSHFISTYEKDERSGVIKMVESARKRLQKWEMELNRLSNMRKFESDLTNLPYICGVDEVGRGPLAGPVVAAAVILPKDLFLPYVNDSKKLSEERRESLYKEIMEKALAIGVARVENEEIDEINILNASLKAMKMAIEKLPISPDFILVDGNQLIPGLTLPQKAVVKGDEKSISIAAASIVAKVTRDRIMVDYDKAYPMYEFARNKGYGSKRHYEGLEKFGLSPLHRISFVHI